MAIAIWHNTRYRGTDTTTRMFSTSHVSFNSSTRGLDARRHNTSHASTVIATATKFAPRGMRRSTTRTGYFALGARRVRVLTTWHGNLVANDLELSSLGSALRWRSGRASRRAPHAPTGHQHRPTRMVAAPHPTPKDLNQTGLSLQNAEAFVKRPAVGCTISYSTGDGSLVEPYLRRMLQKS